MARRKLDRPRAGIRKLQRRLEIETIRERGQRELVAFAKRHRLTRADVIQAAMMLPPTKKKPEQ
jgi:hypothetical protein